MSQNEKRLFDRHKKQKELPLEQTQAVPAVQDICASDIYHHHISILHKSLQDVFAYNLVKNTSGRLVTGGNNKLE